MIGIEKFVEFMLEAVEGLDPAGLNEKTVLEELEEWDSLAALSMITLTDERFDVGLNGQDLENCRTVKDLFEMVNERIH